MPQQRRLMWTYLVPSWTFESFLQSIYCSAGIIHNNFVQLIGGIAEFVKQFINMYNLRFYLLTDFGKQFEIVPCELTWKESKRVIN